MFNPPAHTNHQIRHAVGSAKNKAGAGDSR